MSNATSKLVINSVEYELKDELARNEISTLDNELDSLKTTTTNHSGRINTLESDVSSLDNELDSLQTTSTNHSGRIESLESDVSSLDNELDSLQTISGSNENGHYIKFSDGTMICYATVTVDGVTVPVESFYRSEQTDWSYPEEFLVPPSVSGHVITTYSNGWIVRGGAATTRNSTSLMVYTPTERPNSGEVGMLAIGRWK